jgi:hypothetical protein
MKQKNHEPSIREVLNKQRAIYLEKCEEDGGTAGGFRDYIAKWQAKDPLLLEKWKFEALMEATTLAWQAPPKKRGDDLFSISDVEVHSHITRPIVEYANGEEIEAEKEDAFEKVSCNFATIHDWFQEWQIKVRKAAQSSAAAEKQAKGIDEARKRAKGDMTVLLRDVADAKNGNGTDKIKP